MEVDDGGEEEYDLVTPPAKAARTPTRTSPTPSPDPAREPSPAPSPRASTEGDLTAYKTMDERDVPAEKISTVRWPFIKKTDVACVRDILRIIHGTSCTDRIQVLRMPRALIEQGIDTEVNIFDRLGAVDEQGEEAGFYEFVVICHPEMIASSVLFDQLKAVSKNHITHIDAYLTTSRRPGLTLGFKLHTRAHQEPMVTGNPQTLVYIDRATPSDMSRRATAQPYFNAAAPTSSAGHRSTGLIQSAVAWVMGSHR